MAESKISIEDVRKLLQAHPTIKAMIKNLSESLRFRSDADVEDAIYGLATGANDLGMTDMPQASHGTHGDRTSASAALYMKMVRHEDYECAERLKALVFADGQITTALSTLSKNEKDIIVNRFYKSCLQFGKYSKKNVAIEMRQRSNVSRNIKRILMHLSTIISMTQDECRKVFKITGVE